MFGSQILEVAIGVIFVFILVSIICTVIREWMEALLGSRAAFLERGIRELLNDKAGTGLAKSFYEHPLIYSLFAEKYTPPGEKYPPPVREASETDEAYAKRQKDYIATISKKPNAWTMGSGLPSYIPTKNFAIALMDIAARGQQTDAVSSDGQSPRISLDSIRQNITNIDSPAVQRAILTALDTANGSLDQAQANLEAWYDSGMDRVSGWYKRSSQWVIFWIAAVVAVAMNINTITIADYLAHNDVARAALVARAEAAVKDSAFQGAVKDTTRANQSYARITKQLNSLDLPIGWSSGWGAPRQHAQSRAEIHVKDNTWNDLFGPLLGWFITAIAATLGAPFWFDILNKIMVIRSTVKPHEKSPEEASEDRQLKPSPAPAVAPAAPAAPSAPATVVVAEAAPPPTPETNIRDAESNLDGCDVETDNEDLTPDEDLPRAEGGVA